MLCNISKWLGSFKTIIFFDKKPYQQYRCPSISFKLKLLIFIKHGEHTFYCLYPLCKKTTFVSIFTRITFSYFKNID